MRGFIVATLSKIPYLSISAWSLERGPGISWVRDARMTVEHLHLQDLQVLAWPSAVGRDEGCLASKSALGCSSESLFQCVVSMRGP